MILELVHVGVHTVGRGGTHRTARIALGSLGRSGIEHRIVLEILWQILAGIQTSLQLSMSDIAGYDDGALQIDTCRNGIFRQFGTYRVDALVQVDNDGVATLACLSILSGNEFRRIVVHLLQPDTVAVDLSLDIAVGRTADAHTDRTAGTMTRQTHHTDIVGHILTAKLCAKANLVGLLEQFLLQVDITEGATGLIACGRQ